MSSKWIPKKVSQLAACCSRPSTRMREARALPCNPSSTVTGMSKERAVLKRRQAEIGEQLGPDDPQPACVAVPV